jgi:hypothetical protein
LSERKKLRTAPYGKKLVYALPRTTKNFDEFEMMSKIRHGLACTEALVRFYRSRTDGEIIAERFFRGCGSVPEWGIRYPDGKLLLSEVSMKSNFEYTELMNGKLNAYDRNIEKIEEKFQAKPIVVFVIDIPRERVERYVRSLKREKGPYWFTDLQTFLSVPLAPQGNQLTAPIYYWLDGKEYPLKKND